MLPCHSCMIHFSFQSRIIGFSSSEGTTQCWELTSHVVAKIKSDIEERVGLKKDVAKPRVTARKNRF